MCCVCIFLRASHALYHSTYLYLLLTCRTMSALSGAAPPPAATEELTEEAEWVPRMDGIRQARGAEIEAMESLLGSIASKHQSSLTKLRRQVDTIMAWKIQMVERDRKAATMREVARREAAEATKKAKLAAVDPGNTCAVAAVTPTQSAAAIVRAEQFDQNDIETPEERVQEGECGVERLTKVWVCVCVRMFVCVIVRLSFVWQRGPRADLHIVVTAIRAAERCTYRMTVVGVIINALETQCLKMKCSFSYLQVATFWLSGVDLVGPGVRSLNSNGGCR